MSESRPPCNAFICYQCGYVVMASSNSYAVTDGASCPRCNNGSMDKGWVFDKPGHDPDRHKGGPKGAGKWLNDHVDDWSEYWDWGEKKFVIPNYELKR